MKLIVLAAGKSSISAGLVESPPVCLRHFDNTEVVLDTLVAMGQRANASKSIVVGGYRILDIMQARPNLSYYYNSAWEKSGSLASLLQCAQEFDDDLVIAYSDVVHNRETAQSMIDQRGKIVVAFDSEWKTRYEGRTAQQRGRAEVLIKTMLGSHRIARTGDFSQPDQGRVLVLGEFAGLIFLRKELVLDLAATINSLIVNDKNAGIADLLAALDTQHDISLLDLKGKWAELDSEADLASFRFGTKAETLTRLRGMLTHGHVLRQYTFTVNDWRERQNEVLNNITEQFAKDKHIVARSSAVNEDTETESMAGNFESVLEVPVNDTNAMVSAINHVCNSYFKDGACENPENQIFVQPMLVNVRASGVVFTSDLETAAPYYTIEMDRTGSTDSVTSGSGGEIETIIVARDALLTVEDPYLQALIIAIKEIEQLTGFSSLDIEFAITNGVNDSVQVEILQVRPIAAHKEQKKVDAESVDSELNAISEYLHSDNCIKTPLLGAETAYGVMPDWNPAEIIGINPRPLAFSLYRHIITDQIWGKSREDCGYRSTFPRPGLVSLSGKPYVDVRMSFSSFVPKTLDEPLATRLVEFAVNKLKTNPELHDKVEFEVMPTIFDLDFASRMNEWKQAGFSAAECESIRTAYHALTIELMDLERLNRDLDSYNEMNSRRNVLLAAKTPDNGSCIETIRELLRDCKQFGTLPFSNLARYAFVGVTQLKSLVKRNVIASDRYAEFLASIITVAKQFVIDLTRLTKPELIREYGHLRPGTYDITSLAYCDAFDHYMDLDNRITTEETPTFQLTNQEATDIRTALQTEGIDIEPEKFLEFIRAAIQGRELGKLEFTKNLSVAMDLIAGLGESYDFTRDELSFLEIDDILELATKTIPANLVTLWKSKIDLHRRQYAITCAIKLPELIASEHDIWSFVQGNTKPNFITQKTIVAPTADVANCSPATLDGKLCLIENADPGFDWIFSHRIAGLVTAYGGANSHMAIRCAEFELPAVIGCGDSLYRTLRLANRIRIDCTGKTVEALS